MLSMPFFICEKCIEKIMKNLVYAFDATFHLREVYREDNEKFEEELLCVKELIILMISGKHPQLF